ncbi:MAG TPA: protein kinase, partial [Planctomycetota bacterium]|nr:protein kinase [Planctomycetota bacterium]
DALGTAWVADFGLAKLSDQDDLTQSGDILGTLQYLAPECLKGKVDERSDVYSLALTLYEMLTLQPPYPNTSTLELLQVLAERDPARPRQVNPHIPQDLETIVLKGSARNPADRYPNARALADDLRRFLDDRPISARQAGTSELIVRWCRRNRALAALGMTAVASLVLALVVGWAGYVSTTGALARESQRRTEAEDAKRRAEANMKLSLGALEEVFASVGSGDTFLPLPGGPGSPGPMSVMPGGREGQPPPPDAGREDFRENRRPSMMGQREDKENIKLLQSILRFYDKFAAENQTNGDLQLDALRAQVRVGDLQMRSHQELRAEEAFKRALQMAEHVSAQQKSDAEFTSLIAQAHFGLGSVRQRDQDLDAAETHFRNALNTQIALLKQSSGDVEQRLFLNVIRHHLALVLLDDGKVKDAQSTIAPSLGELEPLAKDRTQPRAPPVLLMCLRLHERLERDFGDEQKADEYRKRADTLEAASRPRGGPQGPRRPREGDRPPPREWDERPPPDGERPPMRGH